MLKTILLAILLAYTLTETITVHLVPHSHDDAGWLWTMEEYLEGNNCPFRVRSILDNFIISLSNNKDRTFMYVEMAFFTKWYKDQNKTVKLKVKELLKEGRFEFINGGYVMHDEAATYYQHIIDQMRLGLMFLKEEFDYKPKVAWFIDPFGHSAASAYILSKMGFDKIVFVRIDQKEKNIRIAQKNLEFYWFPFDQVDNTAKVFTHITYNNYCPPDSLDPLDNDVLIPMTDDDIQKTAMKLSDEIKQLITGYRHSDLMMLYGCDFTYNKADNNYLNVEKIMNYINANYDDIAIKYSTPSKYFKTVIEKSVHYDDYRNFDFFPYADHPYSYWTGYFTSRPFLKGYVRDAGNYLTTSSKFLVEYMLKKASQNLPYSKTNNAIQNLFTMREKLAICQHHDAVAGTATQRVSEDYQTMLSESINGLKTSFQDLIKDITATSDEVKSCIARDSLNSCSELLKTETELLVNLYNPGLEGSHMIHFDLPYGDVNFYSYPDNLHIITDSYCINDESFKYLNKCRISIAVKFIKSQQFVKLKLRREANNPKAEAIEDVNTIVRNEFLIAFFMKSTNSFKVFSENKSYEFQLQYSYYNAYEGEGSKIKPDKSEASGAYLFSTTEERPISFNIDYSKSYIMNGKNFTQLILRFEHSYMFVRPILADDKLLLEVDTIWEPIERVSPGKEYLLHITSDIKNTINVGNNTLQPEMWTDSNGLKLMRRIKDFRGGYDYKVTEKVAANFYPINTSISIRDKLGSDYTVSDYEGLHKYDRVLSVFTDRAQSGGALKEGEIMLILNRFSNKDDHKGLIDTLYELASATNYFRLTHWLAFGSDIPINWVRDYTQNKPTIFTMKQDALLSNESLINRLIEFPDSLDINFHVLKEKEFFVQAINTSDKYFGSTDGVLTFKEVNGIHYSIEEWEISGISPKISGDFIKETHNFNVVSQGIRLFKIKLE
jgi:lysosomal alpha-mannosidase